MNEVNINSVLGRMYETEPYENKQRIYSYEDEGLKLIRYSPKITVVNCELDDIQAHMLFECAKLIKDGHKLVFSKSF